MPLRVRVGDFQINNEEREAIMEVLSKGKISEGEKTSEFEKIFSEYIGTKYCIALSSGTCALMAGLLSLIYHNGIAIKKDTKIITSPLTYVATVNAIVMSGFEPIFVDIDKTAFSIIPECVEECIEMSKNTDGVSVIIPVHLMGYPCDMKKINKIAEKYGIVTFEDSAQAHGTYYEGKRTGSLSKLSAFSFYVAHNIQAGEMGAITTDDYEIYRLVKKIKTNGRLCDCKVCGRSIGSCVRQPEDEEDFDPRFTHDLIGLNFKTMEFQTALAITQLRKADWIFKKRQENVRYLNENLNKYREILKLPLYSDDVSYLSYPIVINEPRIISRKILRQELEKLGIETRPLFGCIPAQQPAYSYLQDKYREKLPNADFIGKNGFYIGCHQYIQKEDLDYIIYSFDKIFSNY